MLHPTSTLSPRSRGWLASSPFKKLTHLKGSCYSLPARRKLEWTGKPESLVKSSKSVDRPGQPPPVNLVTFRAQDMSGESFSTLQMQNIMSSLQHQLGSPQTTSSVDLPSSDPVSTDITQSLSQDIGEDSKSHIAYSTNVSQPNAQDDCSVHPQDAESLQDVHNPEQHRNVESIIGSAVHEVSMERL